MESTYESNSPSLVTHRSSRTIERGRMSRDWPVLPWKTKIFVTIFQAFGNTVRRSDGTINRRLVNFLEPKVPANDKAFKGVKTSDVTFDATRNIWFRLFKPTEIHSDVSLPVIVFFHGGGFSIQSADSKNYDFVCRRFSRKFPAVIVSVNYRLAPEHKFPSQYDDGFDTLKFLDKSEPENFGFPANADLSKCFLAGDSAGGNIAHNVAVRCGKADFKKIRVIGQISIQPFFGGEKTTESEIRLVNAPIESLESEIRAWKSFLPEGENRDHQAVNVSGPRAVDIRGMKYPETMVVVGGYDPLQDWQREFYEWLKRSGKEAKLVEYPNAFHAFYVFPELPESSMFLGEAMDFVRKVCEKVNN